MKKYQKNENLVKNENLKKIEYGKDEFMSENNYESIEICPVC